MRRPLIRHLSEGGGGAGSDKNRRQSIKQTNDDDRGYNWNSRNYRHHVSSCDLLKVPSTNHRGRISPEPRLTVTSVTTSTINNRLVLNLSVTNPTGLRLFYSSSLVKLIYLFFILFIFLLFSKGF